MPRQQAVDVVDEEWALVLSHRSRSSSRSSSKAGKQSCCRNAGRRTVKKKVATQKPASHPDAELVSAAATEAAGQQQWQSAGSHRLRPTRTALPLLFQQVVVKQGRPSPPPSARLSVKRGVVPPLGSEGWRFHRVERSVALANRRCWFEYHAQHDQLTVADSSLDASGVVGRRAQPSVFTGKEGVIVFAASEQRAIEPGSIRSPWSRATTSRPWPDPPQPVEHRHADRWQGDGHGLNHPTAKSPSRRSTRCARSSVGPCPHPGRRCSTRSPLV